MMLQTLMRDYLQESETRSANPSVEKIFGHLVESVEEVPVHAEESEWVVLSQPERLTRKYHFEDDMARNWFLRELLEDESNKGHHGKITIDGMDVTVEVYTLDIDAITELDIEYAGRCDDIFGDVSLLGGLGYGY